MKNLGEKSSYQYMLDGLALSGLTPSDLPRLEAQTAQLGSLTEAVITAAEDVNDETIYAKAIKGMVMERADVYIYGRTEQLAGSSAMYGSEAVLVNETTAFLAATAMEGAEPEGDYSNVA